MTTVLFSPQSYKDASPEEKKIVCNGCGAKGFGGLFVPNTLWGLCIEECCHIHDWMYEKGKTNEDKEEADRVLMNNLTRVIEAESGRVLEWLRKSRAKKYYLAVKYFGGPAFWENKNKGEK